MGYASVSMVCTVHEERGLATVSNLCAILEHIRPDALFLEMPPAAFDDFIKTGSRRNLESDAARRYQERYQVELIPVDLPTPESEFFRATQHMFETIERASREHCSLVDLNSAYVGAFGFDYLNSDSCSSLWADIYEEMRSTVRRLDDLRLVRIYELWNETNKLREKGMLRNIGCYCKCNFPDSGVFLVGASHRRSVIDASRDQSAVEFSLLC